VAALCFETAKSDGGCGVRPQAKLPLRADGIRFALAALIRATGSQTRSCGRLMRPALAFRRPIPGSHDAAAAACSAPAGAC
jgi:hypothetical protein